MTNAIIYVDVDDTLIRSVGSKRIPMSNVVNQIKSLFDEGAELYCWSSGGADYAKEVTEGLKIDHCFKAFLPKPHIMIDDQEVKDWKYMTYLLPSNAGSKTTEEIKPKVCNKYNC